MGAQRPTYSIASCPSGAVLDGGVCKSFTCPAGYTLNGSMCDPDVVCPPGEVKWNGECKPECLFLQRRDQATGECNCDREGNPSIGLNENVDTSGEGSLPDKICVQGCEFNIGEGIGMGAQFWAGRRTTATGAVCNASDAVVDKPQPPKKKPPCEAGEGVMTSSAGTVACVPEGTPGAVKPEVEVKKRKETYPDGSVKETVETTTKDNNTGATNRSTSTTSTGGLSGSAGSSTSEEDTQPKIPGTGSGTGSGDGDGDGDDGDCEGDDCSHGEFPGTDGLYEKKFPNGIKGVLDARFSELRQTPIFSLVNTLVPSGVPNSGACSPFSISMNIGPGMNFGGGSIEVPCYVWSFIRVVMLISAFLLARRLIFGG